jgi:hypothetical protein
MSQNQGSHSFFANSVSDERSRAISKWAEKHTKFPPFDRLGEFIKLQSDNKLHLHAAAARSYKNGDLILQEEALIRLPDAPDHVKEKLQRSFGNGAAFLFPSASADWASVDQDVKEAVLSQFWCHPLVDSSSVEVRDSFGACERLVNSDPALRRSWDARSLMRYLHIVDLNIHKDDENKSHADFSGLFVLGSKFSHSCAPNCTWSFSKDGYLQYHAVRPIKPGDLFTFSYIGNGMNMMAGTVARRRRLGSLWFICLCSRCREPDICRQITCPRCNAPKCIPADPPSDKSWSCEIPLHKLIPEVQRWKCQACGASSDSAQLHSSLKAEEMLSALVPEVMQGRPRDALQDFHKAIDLRQKAAKELGTGHWTWLLVNFAWLQKSLIILDTHTIVEFSERDVQEASAAIAKWFEDFGPELFEQRMSALSLSIKLMQNLGGSLQDWGYDPKDPLGDGCPVDVLAERLGLSKSLRAT